MKIVIDIPEEIMEYVKNNGCLSVIYDDEVAKAIINGTPYEERPTGKWIEKVERGGFFAGDKTVYSYTCPFCGAKEFKKYPFCHCGAEMRVKDELGDRKC